MPRIRESVGRQAAQKARQAAILSMIDQKRDWFGELEIKAASDGDDGEIRFSGFANTSSVDRHGDVIEPRAFRRSLKTYLKTNPMVFYMHDRWLPVATIEAGEVTDKGLAVEGRMAKAVDEDGFPLDGDHGAYLRYVRSLVKQNVVRTMSVGILPLKSKDAKAKDPMWPEKERQVRLITDLELLEISLVTLPANRDSTVEAKALDHLFGVPIEHMVEDDHHLRLSFEEDHEEETTEEPDGPKLELVELHAERAEPTLELVDPDWRFLDE